MRRFGLRMGSCGCAVAIAVALIAVPSCTTGVRSPRVAPRTLTTVRSARARSAGRSALDTTPRRYLSHIAQLASDELGGRGAGSDGIDLAAGYIAGQFAAAGLEPGGPNGTYFQDFTVDTGANVSDATKLTVRGVDAEPVLQEDYTPFGFSAMGDFEGDAVFVGYGITRPDKDYDDYAGVDVKGRVAVMLRREPKPWTVDGYSEHARFDTKIKLASEQGAAAVLIVNQDPGEDGVDGLMRMRGRRSDAYDLPTMHVKRSLVDRWLASAGMPALTGLQKRLDEEGKNVSAVMGGVRVAGTVAFESHRLAARNVIGVLPGEGPHRDEYVVIGGHYDHLGTRRGRIFNGADDNASGTAGVIELARALSRTPYRDRSVICMTFTGEEMGLLGSKHYVEDPTVKLDSIAAMINMDMIGRLSDDEANMLAIQGLGTGDVFEKIVERRAKETGLPFLPDPSALGPSDHDSFYRGGVPSLFFFTGVHEDYHRPGDDTEKINAEGAVRILHLVYAIAMDLVNASGAPRYVDVTTRANIFRGANRGPPGRVTMGIMPDMEDDSDAPGWRVAAVMPGSGAERSGMKRGDRILRVVGTTINGFGDYREAMRDKKPGDTVDVRVLRGGKELTLHVELSGRGG